MQIIELLTPAYEAAWLPWAVQYFFLIGIAATAALLAAWLAFGNCSGNQSHFLQLYLLALPFHLLGWLVLVRGIQAFGRQKG